MRIRQFWPSRTEKQVAHVGAAMGTRKLDGPAVAAIDLSSNDYLGLRNDQRVRAAAIQGIEEYGVGSGGVRDVAVGNGVVLELEARLARFKHLRAARMVQSGYAANLGIIPQLVGEGDVVVLDRQNHQSSRDGATLSGAAVVTYPHADLSALAGLVREASRDRSRKILVVTDGVFGLGGDIASLSEIVEIAERHGATVMVDDAHGSGVLGGGSGTVAHFGLTDRVSVQVGTASKAMGVVGGYVAAPSDDVIARFADGRPLTYSTALPPHLACAALAALDIIEAEPDRIERLWAIRQRLADGLASAGLDLGDSATPIIPVITRRPEVTVALGEWIRAHGVLAAVLVPPKVTGEDSRLRLIATAAHSIADIDFAVSVIAEGARRYGVGS